MNFVDAVVKVNGSEASLAFDKYTIALNAEKSKKLIDGGYDGKTVTMGIRPENVSNDPDALAKTTCKVTEEVTGYELLGAEVLLYFSVGGAKMTASAPANTTVRTGDIADLAFDANAVHVFDKDTELTITN
jgi:multiple sugar transport system ATP-binding protein